MLTLSSLLTSFQLFGVVHFAMFAGIALVALVTIRLRRRLPTPEAARRFDRRLAFLALAIAVANQTSELWPARFELNRSLPLHLCDIVGLIGPLAILTHHLIFRSLLYFWGIGLSTQALITPELLEGPAQFNFWVFWIPHGMIVGLAAYDIWALNYRPKWKDYFIAIATLAMFVALVLPVNLWLEVNYVYVGRGTPGATTVIDFLGPWPLRVFKLTFAVIVWLAVLEVPFVIARSRARRKQVAAPIPPKA